MIPPYPKSTTPTNKTPPNKTTTTTTMLELWTTIASTLASFMFVWTMFSRFVPYELRHFLEKRLTKLYSRFHPYVEITIPQISDERLKKSEGYSAVQAYLSSLSSTSAKRLTGEIEQNGKRISLGLGDNERVEDVFNGAKIWWISGKVVSSDRRGMSHYSYYPEIEKRFFKVTFHQKYRDLVTKEYLEYVVQKGREMKVKNRQRKLYTNVGGSRSSYYGTGMWSHIPFKHPATFESLAMDPIKKREIKDDLLKFRESQNFYARVGKAWKRGYLLFGPPGSGKSTMIAAMANLLQYDVYDLELTAVRDNTELRRLLIETTSKSIIVIEDIDCSLELPRQRKKKAEEESEGMEQGSEEKQGKGKDRRDENANVGSKVTLSGLLNFIDGIWSSCGGERIIVFTTNYVERLDPALIRRGRMDKHIEMGYCGFEGFKILAKNYLCVEEHALFEEIEKLLKEVEITPADVAENLMPKSPEEDADWCLENLVSALEEAKGDAAKKRRENEEREREEEEEMEETREVVDSKE